MTICTMDDVYVKSSDSSRQYEDVIAEQPRIMDNCRSRAVDIGFKISGFPLFSSTSYSQGGQNVHTTLGQLGALLNKCIKGKI